MGWWCKECKVAVLSGPAPCPECGKSGPTSLLRLRRQLQDYIIKNFPTPESAENKCKEAAEEFAASTGLLVVRGYARDASGIHAHNWCETKTGEVFDPTAHQFQEPIEYRKLKDVEIRGPFAEKYNAVTSITERTRLLGEKLFEGGELPPSNSLRSEVVRIDGE